MGDKPWARVLEKRHSTGVLGKSWRETLEKSNGSSKCVEEDCCREVLGSVMSRDVGEKFWRRVWIERVWRDL